MVSKPEWLQKEFKGFKNFHRSFIKEYERNMPVLKVCTDPVMARDMMTYMYVNLLDDFFESAGPERTKIAIKQQFEKPSQPKDLEETESERESESLIKKRR